MLLLVFAIFIRQSQVFITALSRGQPRGKVFSIFCGKNMLFGTIFSPAPLPSLRGERLILLLLRFFHSLSTSRRVLKTATDQRVIGVNPFHGSACWLPAAYRRTIEGITQSKSSVWWGFFFSLLLLYAVLPTGSTSNWSYDLIVIGAAARIRVPLLTQRANRTGKQMDGARPYFQKPYVIISCPDFFCSKGCRRVNNFPMKS